MHPLRTYPRQPLAETTSVDALRDRPAPNKETSQRDIFVSGEDVDWALPRLVSDLSELYA